MKKINIFTLIIVASLLFYGCKKRAVRKTEQKTEQKTEPKTEQKLTLEEAERKARENQYWQKVNIDRWTKTSGTIYLRQEKSQGCDFIYLSGNTGFGEWVSHSEICQNLIHADKEKSKDILESKEKNLPKNESDRPDNYTMDDYEFDDYY